MEKRDFFISYANQDKKWAIQIKRTLKNRGYTVYLQEQDIHVGDNFVDKMNQFLGNSRGFIAVWSQAYSISTYCQEEISAAWKLKKGNGIEVFLPVRVENFPVGPLYDTRERLDLFTLSRRAWQQKLLEKVGAISPTHISMEYQALLLCVVALFLIFAAQSCHSQSRKAPRQVEAAQATDSVEKAPEQEISDTEKRSVELAEAGKRALKQNGLFADYESSLHAFALFQEALKLNPENADALNGMGDYYFSEENYTNAKEYYEKAHSIDGSNAEGLNNLGVLYYLGYGVECNYTTAKDYFEKADKASATAEGKAKEKGKARWYLGRISQKSHDLENTRKYCEEAYSLGETRAGRTLGELYRDEGDRENAFKWFQRAADAEGKEDKEASLALGELYLEDNDYENALHYFEQAAALGSENALERIAALYGNGQGVRQNDKTASEYRRIARQLREMEDAIRKTKAAA